MSDIEQYQSELRQLRAELAAVKAGGSHLREVKPRRLTISEVLEAHLDTMRARAGGEHDSVELSRNARGDVQIKVTVRTGEDPEVATIELAAAKARHVFDTVRGFYPMAAPDSTDSGSVLRSAASRPRAVKPKPAAEPSE